MSDAYKKKCCVENPIDEYSSMCQECYDNFRLMVLEEEEKNEKSSKNGI